MGLNFFKNYFVVFILTYVIVLISKFIFVYCLLDSFIQFDIDSLINAILWGYKFDVAISSIVAFLSALFSFSKTKFALVGAILLTIIFFVQLGDILYFNEASRHIGYEITDTFTDGLSLFMTAYTQHTIFTIVSIVFGILLFLISVEYLYRIDETQLNKYYITKQFVLLLITVFFIRGMFQNIPLNPWQSNQIGDTKLASISLNASYNIVYLLANQKKKLQPLKIPKINKDVIKKSLKQLYRTQDNNLTFPTITTKPNVVFLFLESWSAKYLKSYGYEYNTTPFFDKILQKSIRPKIMIANGHRTTEGMWATLTSLQNPLGKTVAKTQLQDYKYPSIIKELNHLGYSSAFFQGTSKETSGTGSFAQSLGFRYSYGKKDIKKQLYENNYWGVHDVDLYNFVYDILDTTLKEPFTIGINGATTHDDKIPKNIDKIDFTKDKINSQLNALYFSDTALEQFITTIETKYPNTIFVIFADHCGGNIAGILQNYQIPFAIYSKKLIKAKYYDTYLSQRDIATTIYDMVIGNYKKTNIPFSGKSLIQDKNFFVDYYHSGTLGWIENSDIIEINLATNKINCFKENNLTKIKTKCKDIHNKLKINALSFTNNSQKALFENNINTKN
jgi:phosphoglycerol transferase MdoB-like AlkP superfamily enzyme